MKEWTAAQIGTASSDLEKATSGETIVCESHNEGAKSQHVISKVEQDDSGPRYRGLW
jgi:hypothetical protein